MQKLIELLNEYEKENGRNFEVKEIGMKYRNNDLMVISKRYGFIKWLVENDKISYNKVPEHRYVSDYSFETINEGMTDNILMWLAIQDEPIRFLCEILK